MRVGLVAAGFLVLIGSLGAAVLVGGSSYVCSGVGAGGQTFMACDSDRWVQALVLFLVGALVSAILVWMGCWPRPAASFSDGA